MGKSEILKLRGIKTVLWIAVFFSAEALIYHIRWFVPFLQHKTGFADPAEQIQFVRFMVQICNNIIFLFVGYILIRLFSKYQQTGFFDSSSLKVFDVVIVSCIGLAILGAFQIVSDNFSEVHLNQWTSVESIANLVLRSFERLIIFKEPQTMYFLLAIFLWTVKQFARKALFIKNENEAFV
jgi:hypothetical protein